MHARTHACTHACPHARPHARAHARTPTLTTAGDEVLSQRECELFMQVADINSDGKIQYRELVKFLTQ
jgi:hypothetical protein